MQLHLLLSCVLLWQQQQLQQYLQALLQVPL
jgi:hypothetical protein